LVLVESQVEVGHLARRTASGYEEALRLHVVPALGHLRVEDVNHLVIHDWLTSLRRAKGLSDQTVLRVYRTLHRAMADAPLDRNPAALPKHLRPVVRVRREVVRPSPGEIGRFLAHTEHCEQSEYVHPLWRLAVVSGMRRGELAGITWSDVDLDGGSLRVERSLGVDGGVVFAKVPKSAVGRRLIGLDAETVSLLRSHRARLAEDRLRAGEGYEDEPLGLDLVFRVGSDGDLIRPDLISRMFTREWAHAELTEGVSLHSLRHSLASLLVAEGYTIVEVAAHMGHTPEVLQRVYARDLDPEVREARVAETVAAHF
jgi:integrase